MGLYAGTSTNSISILAPGTNADRPASPISGTLRFNTTTNSLDGYSTVWSNISSPPSIITSGLILHLDAGNIASYPGSGTTWYDVSGNNKNGTLTNGPTYTSGISGYFSFDGVDDYIECATDIGISGNVAASIGCWFMQTGGSSNIFYPLAGWGGTTIGDAFVLGLNSSSPAQTYSLNVQFNGGNWNATANNSYSINTWNYFVATKTPGAANTTTKAYLNGVELSWTYTVSLTPSFIVNTNRIGQWVNAGYTTKFPGRISNVHYYNKALSLVEIQQNFNVTRNRYGI